MTLFEYLDRKIPDYYPTMYKDGYTPEQIRYACHRKIRRDYEAREAAKRAEAEANEIPEVKMKRVLAILTLAICIVLAACQRECAHEYTSQITQTASCSTTGTNTYTCSLCEDSYTEQIPMLDHSYSEGIVSQEPSCREEGILTYTCSLCTDSYTEQIPMLDHSYSEGIVSQEPSCSEEGILSYTCTYCGDLKTEPVGMTEHNFGEPVTTKESNCTQLGEVSIVCSDCGTATVVDTIPVNDKHIYEEVVSQQPTCSQEGAGVNRCTLCGYTESLVYAKAEHAYDQGTEVSSPTCTMDGVKEYVCQNCNDILTEAIPATNHTWGEGSTCGTPVTCVTCGFTDYNGLSHEYELDSEFPPTTNYAGRIIYKCKYCDATTESYYGSYGTYNTYAAAVAGKNRAGELGFNMGGSPSSGESTSMSLYYSQVEQAGGQSYLEEQARLVVEALYTSVLNNGGNPSEMYISVSVAYSMSGALGSGFFSITATAGY